MIEYTLIDEENGIDSNGNTVNLKGKIRLINGDKIQVFESLEDRNDYVSNMPKVWNKEAYSQEVNDAHNSLFRSLYLERKYLSIGEISLWIDDAEFGSEAIALRNWWNETCKIVEEYLNSVTEETAQPVEEFIQTFPKL